MFLFSSYVTGRRLFSEQFPGPAGIPGEGLAEESSGSSYDRDCQAVVGRKHVHFQSFSFEINFMNA